ncbi:MAG TPA: radical SAM family heme chaperone HemW [Jatrophihabitantaceae bacterium]|nr:radical SAM family heme chaperone HemW [Jatrophihabitantaceae bacterium]
MPSALPQGDPAPATGVLPRTALESAGTTPFGVYVHVPFCRTRCGYCDFNTYTATELGSGVSQGGYADTLLHEVRLAADVLDGRVPEVSTVFFGGGTPTLLPAEHLGVVIAEIRERFGLVADAEITTEANPETVTPGYFTRLREAGFTRVSIGMQSAVPRVLEVLDRQHRPGRPEEAVAEARAAGFEHVNLDLIYGAPHESDADWQASLDAAVAAEPDHISAYALVVEEGTALARQVARGIVPPPDDDVLADRYVMADETLTAAGFEWYEVSNWATSEAGRCRHNELYWRDANWWGFGPGAHSHVGDVRWWNVKHPARYAALVESGASPAAGRETLDDRARFTERVMLGVRLREGLSLDDLPESAESVTRQLASWGLVEHPALSAGRIVLTQRGRLMADAVVRELLG